MPFKLPFSGTGDMATDIKNALEMIHQWKAALEGQRGPSIQGVVRDGSLMVPAEILANTHGIAFLFYLKAGFVFSGELGTGFVVRRLHRGEPGERWSAPSAITSGGMGWGLQIGAEKIYSAVLLQSVGAVDVFGDKAKVNFGADVALTAGPIGRHADVKGDVGTGGASLNYSYSYTRGAFAGMALNGAIASANPMMNKSFYGQDVSVRGLVGGQEALEFHTPLLDELYTQLEQLVDLARRVVEEKRAGGEKEHLISSQ